MSELEQAIVTVVTEQAEADVLRVGPVCEPPCGVRYRGRLSSEFLGRDCVELHGRRAVEVLLPHVGCDVHIEVGASGFALDGVPEIAAEDRVLLRVLYGERLCASPRCGHPELAHYQRETGRGRFEWCCRGCEESDVVPLWVFHEFERGVIRR